MLQAIVFDFDGVLVDSEPLHHRAFQSLARSLGGDLDYATYLETYVGFDDRDGVRYLLTGRAEPLDAAMEQRVASLCEQKQRLFDDLLAGGAVPGAGAIPGAFELAEAAAGAGLATAIASGATAGEISLMLQALGRSAALAVIVAADDVSRSKPDPQSYALAVERLKREQGMPDLAPAKCLAIEDTEAGLAAAKAAGLQTLGVTTTRPASALHEADRVVDGLTDLTVEHLHAWFDKA